MGVQMNGAQGKSKPSRLGVNNGQIIPRCRKTTSCGVRREARCCGFFLGRDGLPYFSRKFFSNNKIGNP